MRNVRPIVVIASSLLLGCVTDPRDAPSLETRLAAIESAIEAKRQELGVPGASVAIVRDDRVIFLKGFGVRDTVTGQPVTPQTLFSIGSCTKPFTALAAVMSADRGLLSLDDSPRKFLPYFRLRDREADQAVTLRDLLSHRTGLKMDDAYGWFERHPTREGLIRFAIQAEPSEKFRHAFQYNNFLYVAAGEAVAAAHHLPFETVIGRLIFESLGMRATNLSIGAMQHAADFSYGYSDEKARTRLPMSGLAFLDGIAPAGAINSNAQDMARWLRLMLAGGVVDGKRLMSQRGFLQMLSPLVKTQGGHYGLGLYIERWHGDRVYHHPGGVPGFGARCEFVPDRGLGWVVLTNVDDTALPKAIREIVHANLVAQR